MFLAADAAGDGKRLETREDRCAGIPLFLRTVPILPIARQVEDCLIRLHLRLLQREDIRIEHAERLHESLFQAGAQAVDIPGDQFHLASSPSSFSTWCCAAGTVGVAADSVCGVFCSSSLLTS